MKQLFTFVLAAMAFVACTQNDVEELSANRADVPETLTVGFEDGDTRIELNEALKTVWTEGDEVSVFYRSNANQRWAFQGETGDRIGTLKCVDNAEATAQMTNVVVVYPYNTNYWLNCANGNIEATLPAVQSYKEGSYGADGNIMVAESDYRQFTLNSVVGWLRVELTGEGESVKSITLRGNAGEQVAGELYIDTATAEATLATEIGEASNEEQVGGVGGGLEFDDAVFTEVTLNCGSGVELGAEATAFYIALPPQTFAEGITIEINCADCKPMTLSTDSDITIERNHIKPMAAVEYEADSEPTTTANQLCYTAMALVEPSNTSAFNVAIVSNEWDEATGEGIITFDGELTTIGGYAFYWCSSLTSVTIPDGVTTIGDYAFGGCDSLTSVTIPDSVTTIGDNAFGWCESLTEFKGEFATEDERCLVANGELCAFAPAGIKDYTIPDSVTTIGYMAFQGCKELTSVTIPDSVTTIGYRAFYHCDSLTSVYCKAITPPILGSWAFAYYDNDLDDYVNIGSLIYIPAESVEAYKAAKGWSEYAADIVGYDFETGEEIPETPETPSDFVPTHTATKWLWGGASNYGNKYAVSGDGFTIDVHFPTSVATESSLTTGEYAWKGTSFFSNSDATNFTTRSFKLGGSDDIVPIADGSAKITASGDVYTIQLTLVHRDSGYEYMIEYVGKLNDTGENNSKLFYTATAKVEPYFNVAIVSNEWNEATGEGIISFDGELTTIGGYAFYWCDSLTSVTIPDSVTTIGEDAFCNCYSLTSVTIGDSVTTIGNEAFFQCHSLTSVTIGDSVTTIGDYAFDNCNSLTSVTIPDSVTTMGDRAFAGCESLTSITIGDGVTTIGHRAFSACDSLTSVTIPDSVTTIGDRVFAYCSNLAEFKGKFAADGGRCLIKDNTIIAYAEASGTTYTIPDSVTTIGDEAFYYCSSLTSVTIGDSVTTIGDYAFYYCTLLTSVTIGNGVTTIGDSAFQGCKELTSVTIPDSVTTIGYEAFRGCSSLTSVTIGDSVTTIVDKAFYYCTSLTSVTIPDSVTTIGDHAFDNCNSLTSVTIGDSVTMIRDGAFWNCSSLTSVYCKAITPPILGSWAFAYYDNDLGGYVNIGSLIYVPAESVEAYKAAENWSNYAADIVGYDFE